MSKELPLTGGALTNGVIRLGDTVRRPVQPASPMMRDVLLHLERVGFDAAPRWLGVDEQGRDILSWIAGETFNDRDRMHPHHGGPAVSVRFSDEQLAAAFRLLRRYHDTFDGEVMCHGDFGPWNLIWRQRLPYAVIDFDDVHPGDPADDVAYALRTFVSYGFAEVDPRELVRRTQIALQGYGREFDVPAILEREYDVAEERCRRNGWPRELAKLPVERAWLAANRVLF